MSSSTAQSTPPHWASRYRVLLRLALPLMGTTLSTNMMSLVNLALVGTLGYQSLAAVGIANVIILNLTSFFNGLGYSLTFFVAREGHPSPRGAINQWAGAGFYSAATVSVIVCIASLFLPHVVYAVMGVHRTVLILGVAYLKWRLLALCFRVPNNTLSGVLKGLGQTRPVLGASLVANVANVGLTTLFVESHRGLVGAGQAFFMAEVLGFLVIFVASWRSAFAGRFPSNPRRRQLASVLGEGLKIGISEIGMTASMIVFTFFVARFGSTSLAASEIALNLLSLLYMPGVALGSAGTIMIGRLFGTYDVPQIKRAARDIFALGAGVFIVICGLLALLSARVPMLFTSSPAVQHEAGHILMLAAVFLTFDGGQLMIEGFLRGVGDNTFTMWMSVLLGWVGFIPFAYLFAFIWHGHTIGVWLAFYLYIVVLFTAYTWRFIRFPWSRIRQNRET